MSIFDSVRDWFLSPILAQQERQSREIDRARDYREGKQKRQIKQRFGGPDDNLIDNKISLIVDRQISLLFGKGVTFQFPDGMDAEKEYLDSVWDANKQEILLHQVAEDGCIAGTCYVKIVPDGITHDNQVLPRLMALDPAWMSVVTDPTDWATVVSYVITFDVYIGDKKVTRRQIIAKAEGYWTITDMEERRGKWEQLNPPVLWEFGFPPIIHWQNLPARSAYGRPDITNDLIDLQDHYNFAISNRSKILRNHAHPKTIASGVSKSQINDGKVEIGPDEMFCIPTGATIANLEMNSDLSAAQAFSRELRQAIFDNTRTVDLDSLQDKLGSLTNFGLRVLYQDTLSKVATKQELYGDALIELNHRLLILSGRTGNTDGGEVVWPDVLPVNQVEKMQATLGALGAGLVSKETAATELGYTYADEEPKIANDKTGETNIGTVLMKAFDRGGK